MLSTLEEDTVLVAVASKDGCQIDIHFGHADHFRIYQVGSRGVRLLELRSFDHYCQGGYADEDKRGAILRAIADCAALFTARIGQGPKQLLNQAGIEAVDDYPFGQVETAICHWFEQRQRS